MAQIELASLDDRVVDIRVTSGTNVTTAAATSPATASSRSALKLLLSLLIGLLTLILVALVAIFCYRLLVRNSAESSPDYRDSDLKSASSISQPTTTIKTRSYCSQLLPGISKMASGVDITSLDLFPPTIGSPDGFKSALFDFSCSHNRSWSHPNIPHFRYSWPDQVLSISTVPAGQTVSKARFYKTLGEVKKALAIKAGLHIDAEEALLGSFSASSGYQSAKENILKKEASIAEISAYVSSFKIDFESASLMQPNHDFLDYINHRLPARYEDAPFLFQQFLDTFGTHYFRSAVFGGYMTARVAIQNSYLYRAEESEVSAQIEAAFFVAKSGAGLNGTVNSTAEEFNKSTEKSFTHYGGQTNLLDQADRKHLVRWGETVHQNPWLLNGRLEPIENLVRNESMRAQIRKAIVVKRALAYLKDLEETLEMGGFRLSARNIEKLNQIKNRLANPKEGVHSVEAVAKDIADLFGAVQELRDRALLKQYAQPFQKLWSNLYGLTHYAIIDSCTFGGGSKTKALLEEQFRHFISLKDRFDRQLTTWERRPDSRAVSTLIYDSTRYLRKYPGDESSICNADSTCNRCSKSLEIQKNFKIYLAKYRHKFFQFLNSHLFVGTYNLTVKFCSTNDTASRMKAEYELAQNILQQFHKPTNLQQAQNLIHNSVKFIEQHQAEGGFCHHDAVCRRCAQEKVHNWRASWKEYWKIYSDLARPVIDRWFLEDWDVKTNLTIRYCSPENETYPNFEYSFWKAFDDLESSTKEQPENIRKLIQEVDLFLYQFNGHLDHCIGSDVCQSCSKTMLNFQTQWRKWLKYYEDQLGQLRITGAVGCRRYLATACDSPLKDQITEQNTQRMHLRNAFSTALGQPAIPSTAQFEQLVKRYHEMMRFHSRTEVELCGNGNENCRKCVEYNVDCLNGNEKYFQDSAFYCKSSPEWRLIGYEPKRSNARCELMELGG